MPNEVWSTRTEKGWHLWQINISAHNECIRHGYGAGASCCITLSMHQLWPATRAFKWQFSPKYCAWNQEQITQKKQRCSEFYFVVVSNLKALQKKVNYNYQMHLAYVSRCCHRGDCRGVCEEKPGLPCAQHSWFHWLQPPNIGHSWDPWWGLGKAYLRKSKILHTREKWGKKKLWNSPADTVWEHK